MSSSARDEEKQTPLWESIVWDSFTEGVEFEDAMSVGRKMGREGRGEHPMEV